jgi:sugar phosphate permease
MNAPYPLEESILMDFVEKNTRARWKSLDSISDFGWCGSAALGGYIADKWDYSVTFMITAVIQSISIIFFALLLPLVPRKEQQELSR